MQPRSERTNSTHDVSCDNDRNGSTSEGVNRWEYACLPAGHPMSLPIASSGSLSLKRATTVNWQRLIKSAAGRRVQSTTGKRQRVLNRLPVDELCAPCVYQSTMPPWLTGEHSDSARLPVADWNKL